MPQSQPIPHKAHRPGKSSTSVPAQIEGTDNEYTGLLQIIISPAEAIQSVDISTHNFDAARGRATGGVTNVTLRSGTNAFHSSLFEFIQNNAVNARSYFDGGRSLQAALKLAF